jgi:hypothetical protein
LNRRKVPVPRPQGPRGARLMLRVRDDSLLMHSLVVVRQASEFSSCVTGAIRGVGGRRVRLTLRLSIRSLLREKPANLAVADASTYRCRRTASRTSLSSTFIARQRATNSTTSIDRSPRSTLATNDCGRPSLFATASCVSPAPFRPAIRHVRSVRYAAPFGSRLSAALSA